MNTTGTPEARAGQAPRPTSSSATLSRTAQDGETTVFVTQYPTLTAYARSLTFRYRLEEDAMELVHDAYCRLSKECDVSKLTIEYTMTTLRNLAIDKYRRRSKRESLTRLAAWERLAPAPDKLVAARMYLRWALDEAELPERQREVLYYRILGFTAAETARKLGLATGTVNNYLTLARRSLSRHYN